jgi:hypothetical protein
MYLKLNRYLSFVILFVCKANCYYYEEQKPIYLTAAVGDYVIFNCNVDFPQSLPIPYMLNWKKEVSPNVTPPKNNNIYFRVFTLSYSLLKFT